MEISTFDYSPEVNLFRAFDYIDIELYSRLEAEVGILPRVWWRSCLCVNDNADEEKEREPGEPTALDLGRGNFPESDPPTKHVHHSQEKSTR